MKLLFGMLTIAGFAFILTAPTVSAAGVNGTNLNGSILANGAAAPNKSIAPGLNLRGVVLAETWKR